jgi:serine/threonine protein kinase
LRRALTDKAHASAIEVIAAHIEQCPDCAGVAVQCLAEARDESTDPNVRSLIARLRNRPADPSLTFAETGSGPTMGPPAAGDEGLMFAQTLEPRATGEIGWLDHYRILKQLGQGGMGVVYLAEDTQLGRQVALKVMQPACAAIPSNRERFLREARAAAALTHDHVVTIHQVGQFHGAPYLAMQFLQGESLDSYLRRKKPLTPGQICRIGREAATGLAAAHVRGLIHRDIKAANLWLEAPKGRVKILDFGLARIDSDVNLTGSGQVLGTPAYMSPEQARAQPLDGRSDLWSLGVVLYRLCTGQMPFRGDDVLAVLTAIALENPPRPEEVNPATPPDLAALVMQLLAKNRDERPATAGETVDRLRSIERDLAQTVKIASPSDGSLPSGTAITTGPSAAVAASAPAAAVVRRRRRIGPIVVACAAVMLAGGVYLYRAYGPSDHAGPPSVAANGAEVARAKSAPKDVPPLPEPTPPPREVAAPSPAVPTAPKIGAVITDWKSRKTERGFRMPTNPENQFTPLVTYFNEGRTILVMDEERLWQRPSAGGAWQATTIAELCRDAFRAVPLHAAISPSRRYLAFALAPLDGKPGRGKLGAWDLVAGRLLTRQPIELERLPSAVAFMAFQQLGTVGPDGVHMWFRMLDAVPPRLPAPAAAGVPRMAVTAIAPGYTESHFAFGTDAGLVIVRERAGNEVWASQGPRTAVEAIVWAAGGRRVVSSATFNGRLWDAANGGKIADLPIRGRGLAASPDGRIVAGAIYNGGRRTYGPALLDAVTGRLLATGEPEHADEVPALAFSPDGKSIMTLDREGVLKFWDVPAAVAAK